MDLVVMDWGIGGLSVYNEIRQRLPGVSILYYSDSGQTPYGKMSSAEMQTRLRFLIHEFQRQSGAKHFVIACNAASTALPALKDEFKSQGLFVTGVIDRGLDLIRASKFKRIAVIGGRRTILSRAFTTPFAQTQRHVRGRIAQPLSALIEEGQLDTAKMLTTLAHILKPFKTYDALVLACTHYPAVAPQIQALLPDCALLDPAHATAEYVQKKWRLPQSTVRGKTQFMTSGDADQMKRAALLAFHVKIDIVIEAAI